MEEKAPIFVDGVGLTKNQQNNKEDISIDYFPKTAYLTPEMPNVESVDKTTNKYLEILAPHLLWKTNHTLFWFNKNKSMYHYFHRNLQEYVEQCE